MHGRYPQDVVDDLAARGVVLPVQDGDLEIISDAPGLRSA